MKPKELYKVLNTAPADSIEWQDARDEAADLAYNYTFENNINPEAVPKLLRCLEHLLDCKYDELSQAELFAKEAIKKAKLK